MITLSLCMIVKDEEITLSRCLESVRDCFDELIIVDTGSHDATIQIAKKYTKHVYHFAWCQDFSKARNASFSYATCDYIMWLDADDILTPENREHLVTLKHNTDNTCDGYMLPYAVAYDENGNPTFTYYRERIVKRETNHSWVGRVHETLSLGGNYIYNDSVIVHHKSVKTSYSERNLDIYRAQLKEDGSLSPRDQFYFGRELFYHAKFSEAIHVFESYLASGDGWIENRIEAYRFLAKSYEEKNELEKAILKLLTSFTESLPRAETCCELGRLYMTQNKLQEAIYWYHMAYEHVMDNPKGAFRNKDFEQYIPCLQLCVCYDRLGDRSSAIKYNELAAQVRPHSSAILHNQRYFESISPNKSQ